MPGRASAIRAPFHCEYPFGGAWSSSSRTRRSVVSSYLAGSPERGESPSPASRSLPKRCLHLDTLESGSLVRPRLLITASFVRQQDDSRSFYHALFTLPATR